MSTGQMMTLIVVFAGLSLGMSYVVSTHQNRVAAEMVQAHQVNLQGVQDQLQALEQRLQTEPTAQGAFMKGCQTGLQQTGVELGRHMEGLLVKQELRLIRTLGMTGAGKPSGGQGQQVIQPLSHQRISPQSTPSGQSGMQVVVGAPEPPAGGQQ